MCVCCAEDFWECVCAFENVWWCDTMYDDVTQWWCETWFSDCDRGLRRSTRWGRSRGESCCRPQGARFRLRSASFSSAPVSTNTSSVKRHPHMPEQLPPVRIHSRWITQRKHEDIGGPWEQVGPHSQETRETPTWGTGQGATVLVVESEPSILFLLHNHFKTRRCKWRSNF